MVIHALGSDDYLRGDEVTMKSTAIKYMPYLIIAGAVLVTVLIMVGTGGRRT